MAKIQLTKSEFSIIPEGMYIFKIINSVYIPTFGKLEVELITAEGYKYNEKYNFINEKGEINEKAQNAFSFFAKTALNDFNLEEIDHQDIVGCYIKCAVEHEIVPSRKDPSKNVTFVKLTDKSPASGFESTTTKAVKNTKVDLDSLLG